MLDESVFKDRELILSKNDIKTYHFWTIDIFVIYAIKNFVESSEVPFDVEPYLDMTRQFMLSDKFGLATFHYSKEEVFEILQENDCYWFELV